MVVVFGEALVDLLVDLAPGNGGEPLARPVPGGCGLNLAIGLARLQCPAHFIGGLSGDPFGQFLARRLQEAGVVLPARNADSRPTRLVSVIRGPGGEPEYGFYGSDTADLAAPDTQAVPADARILAFCSYPCLSPEGLEACRVLARAQPRRLVSFDPNVRPSLDPDLARWRSGCEAMIGISDIVKLSLADLHALWGADCDPAIWAGQLLASGTGRRPALVVITQGAQGARLFSAGGTIAVPAPRVDVVDTVGAGDAFHAAFLSALLARLAASAGDIPDALSSPDALAACHPDRLEAVLARAVLAGSLTCTRPGADPPDKAELDAGTPP